MHHCAYSIVMPFAIPRRNMLHTAGHQPNTKRGLVKLKNVPLPT